MSVIEPKLFLSKILLSIIFISLLLPADAAGRQPGEQYPRLSERVDSVMRLLTTDEKIGQLNQLAYSFGWGPTIKKEVPADLLQMIRDGKIGSFLNATGAALTKDLQSVAITESRLKIPLLFGFDVIHGFKATFPVPLAEASSWDTALVSLNASWQALEAASVGINWTFSPMVDIARDPRWGRVVEGAGEDPVLGSAIAAARVRGLQQNPFGLPLAACVKHFAAYGAAEGGRDYNTADVSERTLREIYYPPFKAAVDAGAMTFMCSFNEIAGVPSSANKYLLDDVLRKQWGFSGLVVSDWNSIGELCAHGCAADLKEAAEKAINAGVDMDMESRGYTQYLKLLIKEGKIDIGVIDDAVRRVLKIKFMLGLFDDPFKYCSTKQEAANVMSREIVDATLRAARKSIVLLKNADDILPLKKSVSKIAVIGPLAASKQDPLGSWEQMGEAKDVVSLIEGIRAKVPGTEILTAQGCTVTGQDTAGFKAAREAAANADLIILAIGEEGHMSGEARSRISIDLPGMQEKLFEELMKAGKPVITVLMNGRPLAIANVNNKSAAVIEAWFTGLQAGTAIADVIFGDYNPSARLPITFPAHSGQIPIHYNHKMSSRPFNADNSYTSKYIDGPNQPLYPFGYGLSYSNFKYGKPSLSSDKLGLTDSITVSFEVTNTGKLAGEETAQLYIHDQSASVTRPIKELKGFSKIYLEPGQAKTVTFVLKENDLRFWGLENKWISEPGKFSVYTGPNSRDCYETNFTLSY